MTTKTKNDPPPKKKQRVINLSSHKSEVQQNKVENVRCSKRNSYKSEQCSSDCQHPPTILTIKYVVLIYLQPQISFDSSTTKHKHSHVNQPNSHVNLAVVPFIECLPSPNSQLFKRTQLLPTPGTPLSKFFFFHVGLDFFYI